jgi:hypothetical protein
MHFFGGPDQCGLVNFWATSLPWSGATKARIESLTDALAEAPYDLLEPLELDQLIASLEPISRRLEATGSNSDAVG